MGCTISCVLSTVFNVDASVLFVTALALSLKSGYEEWVQIQYRLIPPLPATRRLLGKISDRGTSYYPRRVPDRPGLLFYREVAPFRHARVAALTVIH